MQDTKDQLSYNQESTTPPVWFNKELCVVCSAGITTRMQELIESGMSERKASRIMSEETQGDVSANLIRKRYSYLIKPRKKADAELGQLTHLQDVIIEGTNDAELGETSHRQEVITEDTNHADLGKPFSIPLEVGQAELINALDDYFHDKQIMRLYIRRTFDNVLTLDDYRKSIEDAKSYKWEDHQRYMQS